jgi:hypothetical protein
MTLEAENHASSMTALEVKNVRTIEQRDENNDMAAMMLVALLEI